MMQEATKCVKRLEKHIKISLGSQMGNKLRLFYCYTIPRTRSGKTTAAAVVGSKRIRDT